MALKPHRLDMTSELNTAQNTALPRETASILHFKPLSTEVKLHALKAKPSSSQEILSLGEPNPVGDQKITDRTKRKPGRERGIWFEHGTYAASAGKHPTTGKRERAHGFATVAEARKWRANRMAEIASLADARRITARRITAGESVDAVEAIDLLLKAGFKGSGMLQKVAEDYIARHPEAVPTTVREFFRTWIDLKVQRDRRGDTIRSAKNTFGSFLRLHGDKPLTSIRLADIEAFVFDPALPNATTRRGRGTVVRNFFNNAQTRGLIGSEAKDHPCFGLVLPDAPEGEPDPWPLNDFETLLQFALKTEDQFRCTAYILLGGYTGIRTEELFRLRFGRGQIDIDEGLITVSPKVAKKRRQRVIDMVPELQVALKALRDRIHVWPKHWRPLPRPTDSDSKVVSRKLLIDFKAALRMPVDEGGAGLPIVDEGGKIHRAKNGKVTLTQPSAWHDNGLRASFATYHFERDNDARLTSAIMGHTGSLDVFFSHYRALATKGDGKRYFAIAPKVFNLQQTQKS